MEGYKNISKVPVKNCISKEKQKDVSNLLKFISQDPEVRKFYEDALKNPTENGDNTERVYNEQEPFL